MGGFGSGRRESVGNLSGCLRLDTGKLVLSAQSDAGTAGRIDWSNRSSASYHGNRHAIILVYTLTDHCGVKTAVTQEAGISWVPCHLGGRRFFVRCPHCSRRARFLYLFRCRFVCRYCTRLRYWSQTKDEDTRLCNGIRNLQARLAAGDYDLDPDWVPWRPRGMRRHTYRRLIERLARMQDRREEVWAVRLLGFMRRWGAPPEDLLK